MTGDELAAWGAPERIWIRFGKVTGWSDEPETRGRSEGECYILATPEALAKSPEVQALIFKAEAKVWEKVHIRDRCIQELEAWDGIVLLRNEPYGEAP